MAKLDDALSDASGTSYAASQFGTDGLTEPPIPKGYNQGPIKCPFCQTIIQVDNLSAWRKHFYRDLRPYVCLAEDCRMPDRLYSRRREWVKHMELEHWRVWTCPLECSSMAFPNVTEFGHHVFDIHGSRYSVEDLGALANLGSNSDPTKVRGNCPLCIEAYLLNAKEYQRHVGHHLEQLALFVVSSALYDAEDSDGDSGAEMNQVDGSESSIVGSIDGNVGMDEHRGMTRQNHVAHDEETQESASETLEDPPVFQEDRRRDAKEDPEELDARSENFKAVFTAAEEAEQGQDEEAISRGFTQLQSEYPGMKTQLELSKQEKKRSEEAGNDYSDKNEAKGEAKRLKWIEEEAKQLEAKQLEAALKDQEEKLAAAIRAVRAEREKLEAAQKAEKEAREAAAKKAQEEAEWWKKLEDNAKLKAEAEVREKLEVEERKKKLKAEQIKLEAAKEKLAAAIRAEREKLEAAQRAKEEAKEAAAKKAQEEAEWWKKLEDNAKLKAEAEVREKLEAEERKKKLEAKKAAEDTTSKKKGKEALKKGLLEEAK
jgi:hypothetical protein